MSSMYTCIGRNTLPSPLTNAKQPPSNQRGGVKRRRNARLLVALSFELIQMSLVSNQAIQPPIDICLRVDGNEVFVTLPLLHTTFYVHKGEATIIETERRCETTTRRSSACSSFI
eukprot:scaffold6036_cov166-Skeletonema_marinoi.AAC.1